MELKVRKVGVVSLGKVVGATDALIGLIFGAILSLFSVIGAGFASAAGDDNAFVGMIFGVGAIILLPIFYGIFGFLGGMLVALIFNVVSGIVGGLELEVDGPALEGYGGTMGGPPPVQPTTPATY